jgi:hypothetical protein
VITPIDRRRILIASFSKNIPVVSLARKYIPNNLSSDAGSNADDEAGAF